MGIEVKITSRIPQAISEIKTTATQRMREAVNEVRNETLKTLAGSRSGRRYRIPGTSRFYTASAPGEPPAQRLGELRQSISDTVESEGTKIVGKVGTDKPQGPRLEFGFTDTDKLGRRYNMKARPWLRPSFERALDNIKGIFNRTWL